MTSAPGRSSAATATHVRRGMESLRAGKLELAAREFAAPLRYDPQNSQLRFLNAFANHLIAERSDPDRYDHARIGYELALKFDTNNWLAAQQLGRLALTQRDYPRARDYFVRALLVEPNNPELLHVLAQASYYVADLETALPAIAAAYERQPNTPEIAATYAMIAAAAGQRELAWRTLDQVRKLDRGMLHLAKLETRLKDWDALHATELAPADVGGGGAEADVPAAGKSAEPAVSRPRMAMVDVVMIRTEENETSSKGVNLLENINLTFASTYSLSRQREPSADQWSGINRSITATISLSDVKYFLDVFDAGDDRTEVLALPTLIALDGRPSTSFTGSTLNVALKGVQTATLAPIDTGVTLTIQPTFLSADTLALHVLARRTMFEPGVVSTFQESLRTSKTEVEADVVLDFGETLVLTGMREKQTTGMKSGVPVLGDIPGLQYLFSREITTDFHKSTLILLTPRRITPGLYRSDGGGTPAEANATPTERAYADEFRRRYGYLFRMEPNVVHTMAHLDKHRVAQGIRSTDLFDQPWWGNPESVELILRRASAFLVY